SRVFLLLLPPPLRCTLVPYTTLFRSFDRDFGAGRGRSGRTLFPVGGRSDVWSRGLADVGGVLLLAGHHGDPQQPAATGGVWAREDRKSTRLNSSHVKISYAVFCLKKK